jgi:RHS repeat-associated protein
MMIAAALLVAGCADAGKDRRVVSGEEVVLDGSASSPDFGGEIKHYKWKQVSGPKVLLEDNETLQARFTAPDVSQTKRLRFMLTTVEEGGYRSPWHSRDVVTITVDPREDTPKPPHAVAEANLSTVLYGEAVAFDASHSSDEDGHIVSYLWYDESNRTLSTQSHFTYTFAEVGRHTVTLQVTDDDALTDTDSVQVDVKAVLESMTLSAAEDSLEVGEQIPLSVIAHYSDGSTQDVSTQVSWQISDSSLASIDANATLHADRSGTVEISAYLSGITSNTLSIQIKEPVVLERLLLSPQPVILRAAASLQLHVTGEYSDGSSATLNAEADYTIADPDIATVDESGLLHGITEGNTTLQVSVGTQTLLADIRVTKELNTSNFTFTNFGHAYIDTIPADATKEHYDEKRFCMITGQIAGEDGSPLSGVRVSIHNHPEYGSVVTNTNGSYVIPAEGGVQLTMRYQKIGYTTVDRNIQAPIQDWVRTKDVTMLRLDGKVTHIDLNSTLPQMHTSTPVVDERGERRTTLVFDGVRHATVTAPDGSTRELTGLDVRATEFRTPDSMPSDLPHESAYTYCSDLTVDGVGDDENVTFDAPVIMYVDNFLGFDVGEIVPIGYYDRNDGRWKASDNGVVVKLLDTDGDGKVDALDSTGDDQPDDLNGNGSVTDEVVGIADNPAYTAGKTYWRAAITHFTPWDHNWPYGPPEDATDPDTPDVDADSDDEPNDCHVNVSSFIAQKSRVFHEDIPIAGTDITLHYSSKRAGSGRGGYIYRIDASFDATDAPASVSGAYVTCEVAGRRFSRSVTLGELNTLTFEWDGRDASGRYVNGEVTAKVTAVYRYRLVYLRATSAFNRAWARAGGSSTNVIGRDKIEYKSSKTIVMQVASSEQGNADTANGWSFSNVHTLGTKAVFKGDGTVLNKTASLEDGLVAYYRFEGDVKDSGGYHYDGIIYGSIRYDNGVIGKAVRFSNFMDLVEIPYKLFDNAKETTVTMWIKFDESDQRAGLLSVANSSHDNEYLLFVASGYGNLPVTQNGLLNGTFQQHGCLSQGGKRVDDTQFHHLAIVTKADQVAYYIDGELDTLCPLDLNRFNQESSIWLGNDQDGINGGFEPSQQFKGLMDEVRIYQKSLTPEEITTIYSNERFNVTRSSLDTLKISDHNTEYQFDLDGKHIATNAYPSHKKLQTFTYDDQNRLIAMTDRFGQVTTIERDDRGYPTRIIAPGGQVTTLTVDEKGDLIEVGYEDGSRYTFSYFDGSLMDTMTDPNGNLISHSWNADGRIIEEVDGIGGSYRFLRNVNGNETFYSTVYPEGETRSSRDVRLANGDTHSTITLPTGETFTATFAKDESRTTMSRDGVDTEYTYTVDPLTHQRIIASRSITQPSGLKQQTTYTTAYDGNETHTNTKTQTISFNGKTATITHDYNNGTIALTTPEGRQASLSYDVDTLLTKEEHSGTLMPTSFSYDAKGRVTKESRGGREISYTYDSRGHIATITDPRGKVTRYSYDVVDNLTAITHPDGTTERFSYDAMHNLLSRTVATPATHRFGYNGANLPASYVTPLAQTTTYTYDKSKHLTQITKPSGKEIGYTYTDGRLDKVTTPEGETSYTYLFADKVGTISRGAEKIEYRYDGTLLAADKRSGTLTQSITYSYDNDFHVTSTTYAGATQSYGYDNDALLTASGAFTLTRDAQNGYVTQLSDGTLTQTRSYNGFGEITEVSDDTFTYTLTQRDNAGAITQKKETLNGTSITYDYTYDDRGRLTEVKKDGTVVESYTYDSNGNRQSATVYGKHYEGHYTLDDALTVYGDNSYRYDEDGYLIEQTTPKGTTTYTYNIQGALTKVVLPGNTTIRYILDPLNRRIAKEVNGTITEKYLWQDLTTLLAVYDKDDNLLQRFEYADGRMPVAMTSNGQKYYLHDDQVGSLRAVSNAGGDIIKEIAYDSFGNVLLDSNPGFKVPFGFAGGLYDSDTGLVHFGFREYDPFTGKWTAKDPLLFGGGDSNLYGYVLNDPVDLVDPEGKNPLVLVALWIIGLSEYANSPSYGDTIQKGPTDAAIILPISPIVKSTEKACTSFRYTDKVIRQMDTDIYHGFPSLIDRYAIKYGEKTIINGADGIKRTRIILPGSINGRNGVYEWIVEPNGMINHRLFNTRVK